MPVLYLFAVIVAVLFSPLDWPRTGPVALNVLLAVALAGVAVAAWLGQPKRR